MPAGAAAGGRGYAGRGTGMIERRIVQISAAAESARSWPCVYALCNDGTLFVAADRPNSLTAWVEMPPIPQPEPTPRDVDDERALRRFYGEGQS